MIQDKLRAEEEAKGTGGGKKKGFGLMKSDKEKGKNLDVAVTKIEGLSIDLVNLRHDDWTNVVID